MSRTAKRLPTPIDPYEQTCDEAIAACDGDMRSAVKALLLANEFLEHELTRAHQAMAALGSRDAFNRNATFDSDDMPPKDRKDWYD